MQNSLYKCFPLIQNSHTIGYYLHTLHLEHTRIVPCENTTKSRFHSNGSTIGFHAQTCNLLNHKCLHIKLSDKINDKITLGLQMVINLMRNRLFLLPYLQVREHEEEFLRCFSLHRSVKKKKR